MSRVSPQRRLEIVDALRRGTVPERGLDVLAVGLDRFGPALDAELDQVAKGQAGFKAVRGEYGSGKTFLARWLGERARSRGFATSEVQVSEGETPLHHLQTVYRRLVERLATPDVHGGALRSVVDGWFFTLEEDVLADESVDEDDEEALLAATDALAERRLEAVTRQAPSFGAVLRAYRRAVAADDAATAEGLLAWLGGQPHVAASVKRQAGIKGDLDHDGALAFLAGLLTLLRDAGQPGLVLVLDEVETLQRVRSDVRERALNALRQLIDEIDAGRFPGLYLVITGTPAFYDGPQGMQRLAPLAQRLHTDFTAEARFDNPRAPQLRLQGFSVASLQEIGQRVRDLYAQGADAPSRIHERVDDDYVKLLAEQVTGELGQQVGIAPRVYLKKLVEAVLDRVDQFDDFHPRRDYPLTITDAELTEVERNARRADSVDEIDLDV
ncbi:BREX system ATP-binding protein BrxD [Egibacter rhizosphaerae]|uniref:BREX system ATP-binding protein BrxD n=1 Tax=Egibacter rhizosphaerae TaxID=1670831 RepID=A0A411YBD2_9ACTN|nr:BREX system ATP-binding protein BrxD [Egibacter rhizosphaerae]QBI18514.1 BREX system ATP-binding protein BrxD [Egibacter rhizosphaerae]